MRHVKKEALVRELYEKYPYPERRLKSSEDAKYFAKWLSKIFEEQESFWNGKKVLDLGSGTGELACGTALCGAHTTGIDFSSASIKKAKKLAENFKLEKRTTFLEKNILQLHKNEFGEEFDVVIALGSLHHTIDARGAFHIACTQIKQNGIIIIGLYNKYSRFRHRIKRIILFLFCGNNIEKRIALGKRIFGDKGSYAWLADKYGQVHESYHSFSEVKKWFFEEKISFVTSKPRISFPVLSEIKLFLQKKEAFFVIIGKKL